MELSVEMDPTALSTEPLATRTICKHCGHLHRRILALTCACCGKDIRGVAEQERRANISAAMRAKKETTDAVD